MNQTQEVTGGKLTAPRGYIAQFEERVGFFFFFFSLVLVAGFLNFEFGCL